MKEALEALVEAELKRRLFLTLAFGRTYEKQMDNELHLLREHPRNKYQELKDECDRLKNVLNSLA